jgi:hypothetical protein
MPSACARTAQDGSGDRGAGMGRLAVDAAGLHHSIPNLNLARIGRYARRRTLYAILLRRGSVDCTGRSLKRDYLAIGCVAALHHAPLGQQSPSGQHDPSQHDALAVAPPQQAPSGQHAPSGQQDPVFAVATIEAAQQAPFGQQLPSGQQDALAVVASQQGPGQQAPSGQHDDLADGVLFARIPMPDGAKASAAPAATRPATRTA